jgi:hypothetical protein
MLGWANLVRAGVLAGYAAGKGAGSTAPDPGGTAAAAAVHAVPQQHKQPQSKQAAAACMRAADVINNGSMALPRCVNWVCSYNLARLCLLGKFLGGCHSQRFELQGQHGGRQQHAAAGATPCTL